MDNCDKIIQKFVYAKTEAAKARFILKQYGLYWELEEASWDYEPLYKELVNEMQKVQKESEDYANKNV